MTERKEFKLWTDRKTREHYENLADLFAIIKTTDKLEKAWIRASSMPAKDYEDACSRLIAQFRTVKTALGWDTQRVEAFMKEYKMVCSNARLRLIESGVPATVEYGQPTTQDDGQRAKASAEAVHYFITAMDGLKLDLKAVDEIYPQLNDIVSTLNRVSGLPQDFPGKVKLLSWMTDLQKKSASDELSEAEIRQLLFDIETAYQSFHSHLSAGR